MLTDRCSPELREMVGASREPYRVICNQLEKELEDTIEMLQVRMNKEYAPFFPSSLPFPKWTILRGLSNFTKYTPCFDS